MVELIAAVARAYVYAGDWVADCPRGCGGVEHLYDRANPRNPSSPRVMQKPEFHCSYCQMVAPIDWPPNLAEITAVLMLRPVPHTRNWYPKDHDVALRFRIPHGQSVDELRAENREHGVPTTLTGTVG
ncbi:hypothetical protein [Streptomyces dubilierae]|uniref:Uncharacterized protein n=1 Tax=Streptomyces dubilierae TaxID=3075533 RepID=A0ABU2P6N2_9ACTN|nr:hypothetical protein [Streptomyces sp. DSM 41921]MDT0387804.1 hypothetical protein [Streptomyces sp. DSM 41921]